EEEPSLTILRDVPGAVWLTPAGAEQVEHPVPARREQLGDQTAMAAPPRRLGAHEARVGLVERRVERALPVCARHPGGVASEGGDADAGEAFFAGLVAEAAAELDCVPVRDSRRLQRRLERGRVELRVATRGRKAPD